MDKQSFPFLRVSLGTPSLWFVFSPLPSSAAVEDVKPAEPGESLLEVGGERRLVPLWELAGPHSSFVNLGLNTVPLCWIKVPNGLFSPRQGMPLCTQNGH